MLLHKIRADLDQARKDKNQWLLTKLTTLYSESQRIGKDKRNGDSTDEEVLSTVRKFKIGVEENAKVIGLSDEMASELHIYNSYLPSLLSEDELKTIIDSFINELPEKNPKQMGIVMGKLKTNYLGKYDGTIASTLVKQLLQ